MQNSSSWFVLDVLWKHAVTFRSASAHLQSLWITSFWSAWGRGLALDWQLINHCTWNRIKPLATRVKGQAVGSICTCDCLKDKHNENVCVKTSLWHTQKINGIETIFTQKLLVNLTNNYKETPSNTLNQMWHSDTEKL